jgi:hypothetical protein
MARKGTFGTLASLPDPFAQQVLMHLRITGRPGDLCAPIADQIDRLKLVGAMIQRGSGIAVSNFRAVSPWIRKPSEIVLDPFGKHGVGSATMPGSPKLAPVPPAPREWTPRIRANICRCSSTQLRYCPTAEIPPAVRLRPAASFRFQPAFDRSVVATAESSDTPRTSTPSSKSKCGV